MQVIASNDDETVKKCIDIRFRVFVDEQGYSGEEELDGLDSICDHFLLIDEDTNKPAGTARFRPDKIKVTRVAVLPEFRGRKYAQRLVRVLEDHVLCKRGRFGESLKSRAFEETQLPALQAQGQWPGPTLKIFISSQVSAQGLYRSLGYEATGEPYDEDGQPHILMTQTFPFRE